MREEEVVENITSILQKKEEGKRRSGIRESKSFILHPSPLSSSHGSPFTPNTNSLFLCRRHDLVVAYV